MQTLPDNYKKNIEILQINLDRGMSATQANQAIDSMYNQFKRANLLDDTAQNYINAMREQVIEHFTNITVNVA